MMMSIEVTPELVAAYEYCKGQLEDRQVGNVSIVLNDKLELILAALPEEVTNPKPELPTEDGSVVRVDGFEEEFNVFAVLRNQKWHVTFPDGSTRSDAPWFFAGQIRNFGNAKITHLVPEKPPVTVDYLRHLWHGTLGSYSQAWNAVADYVNGPRA
jgi:hypothetical protein